MPIAILALVFVLSFVGTALGATAVDTAGDSSLAELARSVFDAAATGHPAYTLCIMLVAATALLRKYGAKKVPALATDVGGTALVLFGSFFGALAAALRHGGLPSLHMLYTALVVAVSASGGYTMIKRLIVGPLLMPLVAKAPPWLQAILNPALSLFASQGDKVAAAEKAGEEAVKANPPTGAAGVVGPPKDLR